MNAWRNFSPACRECRMSRKPSLVRSPRSKAPWYQLSPKPRQWPVPLMSGAGRSARGNHWGKTEGVTHSNTCLVKGNDHAASRWYAETDSRCLYCHFNTRDHYRDCLGNQAFRHVSQPDNHAVDEPGKLCHWWL